MAMDFTTVLTSDAYRDLLTALVSLDAHLHRLHAQRGESLYREDVEGADADFRDGQQISVKENGILPSHREVADWKSASIEYYLNDLRFEMLVVHWGGGFLNAYLQTDAREMRRLIQEGRLENYHSVLTAVGNALSCVAGLGDIELDLCPFPPASFPVSIFRNESKGFLPAALGLLSTAHFSESEILQMASDLFEVEHLTEYLLLKGKDYPEPRIHS